MKFTPISENELKTVSGGRIVVSESPWQLVVAIFAKFEAILATFCKGTGTPDAL